MEKNKCAQEWQRRLAEKLHTEQLVMLEAFSSQLREHHKRLLDDIMRETQKYEACIGKSAKSEVNPGYVQTRVVTADGRPSSCDAPTSLEEKPLFPLRINRAPSPRFQSPAVKDELQNGQWLSTEDSEDSMLQGSVASEKSLQKEVKAGDVQMTIVNSDQKDESDNMDTVSPSKAPFHTMQSGFIKTAGMEKHDDEPVEESAFRKSQRKAQTFYMHVYVQIFVAGLIAANFITNMIEKQIDPKGVLYEKEFRYFELGYNVAFTIELILNMYAFWWSRFWRSSWNIFDFVVVSIGIFMSLNLPLPPFFGLLRTMRAFRVFRLFKRVQSLNKIIVALLRAVPGVMNAFLIQAITMCIFSILAVEFYQNIGKVCDADGICGPCSNEYITSRGDCIGDEYFGSFLKSLYTFFQVLTGDSWSEAVARPIMWWMDQPVLAFFTAMFFSCYILVAAVVLINVVVAVLLDKMGEPLEDEETPGDEGKQDDETLGTSTRKPKQTS
eukprot:gnl/TRDRNA2_/TRDRNA2_176844_c1_seq30.p1 gnl/TRDRNA2_/TRDRNA2_176844_c1~~gnl/TRDRNA2_/TRDRNA2_176844_c1_seq30.p1  ORF type:complete len:496 (+),score=88.53 gnl/TRDRNA2_/TRDRNA2_176844_c1_seq30:58-1545(+)